MQAVVNIASQNAILDAMKLALGELLTMPDQGIVATNARGTILYANETADDILGIVRLGAGVEDYSIMHGIFSEDGRPFPSTDLPLARAVLHQETCWGVRLVVRRSDGNANLLSVTAMPLYSPDGDHIGATAAFYVLS
jgi:PAS domain-containing protein